MNIDLCQSLGHIQINSHIIGLECLREIRQLLPIVHARVPRNIKGHHAVFEGVGFRQQHADNGSTVHRRGHWNSIVAWFENEIVEIGLTDCFAGNGKVEGEVALVVVLIGISMPGYQSSARYLTILSVITDGFGMSTVPFMLRPFSSWRRM